MVKNHQHAPYGVFFTKKRTILRRPYGARSAAGRTVRFFLSFLDTVRCPVKFRCYLKFHGARTAFSRVIEGIMTSAGHRVYIKTHRCSTEIIIAAALKWRFHSRSYCGICCFKSRLHWLGRNMMLCFCPLLPAHRSPPHHFRAQSRWLPYPDVRHSMSASMFFFYFADLLWWHLQEKWCNEPSAQPFYTAEISAHNVRCNCRARTCSEKV